MSENDRFGRIEGIVDYQSLFTKGVLVIGCGSLGSSVVDQLVRHGVAKQGTLFLLDGDNVEARNLIGTPYISNDIGFPKPEALRMHLVAVDPDIRKRTQTLNRNITEEDIPWVLSIAPHIDLICLFADDFDLMLKIADAINKECPHIVAPFGERCDFAEVAFSTEQTATLRKSMGNRKRTAIQSPRALGVDTAFVATYVASMCLRLLLGKAKGFELCVPCHSNAPLHILGLRKTWLFEKLPESQSRSAVIVHVSP